MPTEEAKRRRFWKRLIVALALWVIVAPIVLAAGLAIVLHWQEKKLPAQRVVPDLKGLDLKSAESKARAAGFSIDVMGSRSDLPGAPGTVVEQMPDEGQSVYLDRIGVVTSVNDPPGLGGKGSSRAP